MYYAYVTTANIYFIMPLLQAGDLFNLHQKHNKLDERVVKFYVTQLAIGLKYLHEFNFEENGRMGQVMHRDLKLENIMLGSDGYLKISDFGLCKIMADL